MSASSFEPSLEVSALLEAYDLDGAIGRPQERILAWAARLQAAQTAKDDPAELVEHAMENDTRRFFFMLEALFRLYRTRHGKPVERLLIAVKEAEDRLGAVDYALSMLENGQKVGLPHRTIAWLEKRVTKSKKRMAKLFQKKWMARDGVQIPAMAKMLSTLAKLPWDDDDADRAFLQKEIARRLEKVNAADYDMEDLEQGVHELRRQLRWLPIYLTALDGIAALNSDLNPIPEYEPLLRDAVADAPFAQLPSSPKEPAPLQLSRSLFIANTKFISEIGELKDFAQVVEGLAVALEQSGEAKSAKKAVKKVLKRLGRKKSDDHHVFSRTAEIFAEIKKLGMLRHLHDEILGKA